MSGWTDARVRRSQRWFPWVAGAIALVTAGGDVAARLGVLPVPVVFVVVIVALAAITLATTRTRVTPRGATAALWIAVGASAVLRILTGLASTLLGDGIAISIVAALVTAAPFAVVAVVFLRRLR